MFLLTEHSVQKTGWSIVYCAQLYGATTVCPANTFPGMHIMDLHIMHIIKDHREDTLAHIGGISSVTGPLIIKILGKFTLAHPTSLN